MSDHVLNQGGATRLSRKNTYSMVFVGLFLCPGPVTWDPCPDGRTLVRQVDRAELIVLGSVGSVTDCLVSDPATGETVRQVAECMGIIAVVRVTQVWKGPTQIGDTLLLEFPPSRVGTALDMKKGETHVVFANLGLERKARTRLVKSNACMLPETAPPTDRKLIEQLNKHFKKQGK